MEPPMTCYFSLIQQVRIMTAHINWFGWQLKHSLSNTGNRRFKPPKIKPLILKFKFFLHNNLIDH